MDCVWMKEKVCIGPGIPVMMQFYVSSNLVGLNDNPRRSCQQCYRDYVLYLNSYASFGRFTSIPLCNLNVPRFELALHARHLWGLLRKSASKRMTH